jgi:prophage regulatory protein
MKRHELKDELPRLIGFREVRRITGLCRSSVWRLERDGNFPRRRLVTATKVAWILSEVLEWMHSRSVVDSESKPAHNLPEPKSQGNQSEPTPARRRSWLHE